MKQYQNLLQKILDEGRERNDRTGTGTVGVFGHMIRFDMREGFPLITTKKLHLKSIIHELLWFLKMGEEDNANTKYLNDNGVRIWDEWADDKGNLGPIYGVQWRGWQKEDGTVVDQISEVIETLENNPDSRRIMVSAWRVDEIEEMALPPCHYGFQFSTFEMTQKERVDYLYNVQGGNIPDGYTDEQINDRLDALSVPKRFISLKWNQRSIDTFLGLPFNIASYALLLMMIAQMVNMVPYELIGDLGDTHLYKNHLDQARLQITREPRRLPTMKINPNVVSIDRFKFTDFQLVDYEPHPHIKGEISI